MIDYIYLHQLQPNHFSEDEEDYFGFVGGSFVGFDGDEANPLRPYQLGHLAMTYTALMSLLTLNDDLSRINRVSIGKGLRRLQLADGSFLAYCGEAEHDMRFVYCACAIASILNLWEYISIPLTIQFIQSCFTYEGGFSLQPGSESQGGATYCAVASLILMNKLEEALNYQQEKLLKFWCLQRQVVGYQGRTGKDSDSCYSFWVGGVLDLLGVLEDTDLESARDFLCNQCQHQSIGGFGKFPGDYPDIVHSYYSLCYLSISKTDLCLTTGLDNCSEYFQLKELDSRFSICSDKIKFYFN